MRNKANNAVIGIQKTLSSVSRPSVVRVETSCYRGIFFGERMTGIRH